MGNDISHSTHEDHDISEDFPRNFLMPNQHTCAGAEDSNAEIMRRRDRLLAQESDMILQQMISSPNQRARLSRFTTEVSPISIDFSAIMGPSLDKPMTRSATSTIQSPMFIEIQMEGQQGLERFPVSPAFPNYGQHKCQGLSEMMLKNSFDGNIESKEAQPSVLTHPALQLKSLSQQVKQGGGAISTTELENIFGGKTENNSSSSTTSSSSAIHIEDDSSSEKRKQKKKKNSKDSSSTSSVSSTTSVSSVDVEERGVDIDSFHTPDMGKNESEGNESYNTEEVNAALEMLQSKRLTKNSATKANSSTNFSVGTTESNTGIKYNNKSKFYGGN